MSHQRTVQEEKPETKRVEVWLLPQTEMNALNECFRLEFALNKYREYEQTACQHTPAANHI